MSAAVVGMSDEGDIVEVIDADEALVLSDPCAFELVAEVTPRPYFAIGTGTAEEEPATAAEAPREGV